MNITKKQVSLVGVCVGGKLGRSIRCYFEFYFMGFHYQEWLEQSEGHWNMH